MKQFIKLAILIGCLGFGISTYGQPRKKSAPELWGSGFRTGNDLLRLCDPKSSGVTPEGYTPEGHPLYKYDEAYRQNQTSCLAYIVGVSDTSVWLNIPNNAESGQLQEIVVAYLTAHPETRQKNAASLVTLALYKFYPAN